MRLDTENVESVLELNEYELHDIIAGWYCISETADATESVGKIKIVPKDPTRFTPELVAKWERLVNEILQKQHELDSLFHVDAGYTC